MQARPGAAQQGVDPSHGRRARHLEPPHGASGRRRCAAGARGVLGRCHPPFAGWRRALTGVWRRYGPSPTRGTSFTRGQRSLQVQRSGLITCAPHELSSILHFTKIWFRVCHMELGSNDYIKVFEGNYHIWVCRCGSAVAGKQEAEPVSIRNGQARPKRTMSSGEGEGRRKRWFPLESNPAVMNAYVSKMGFPTAAYSFCDVLSTEDWALEMVPSPVVGVIMLFPIKEHVRIAWIGVTLCVLHLHCANDAALWCRRRRSPSRRKRRSSRAARSWRQGSITCTRPSVRSRSISNVATRNADSMLSAAVDAGNACGTVGILHALGNARNLVELGAFISRREALRGLVDRVLNLTLSWRPQSRRATWPSSLSRPRA